MTVEIICSTYNGAKYLPDFLRSLSLQTYADWRLWLRDDGSRDSTVDLLRAAEAADARVCILHVGGPPIGPSQAFGWLLEHLPAEAAYVMCADQDDVWLPFKIERTLGAMREHERTSGSETPVLVHTDAVVVGPDLESLHRSFWAYSDKPPEPATLRRLTVANVATGATIMLNRPLRELIGSTPAGAFMHDWWYACVAAAFGRVVAVHEPTMLYRQHSANAIGARDGRVTWRRFPAAVAYSIRETARARADVARIARQARAFLDRYGAQLPASDRAFLADFARIPELRALSRKLALIRLRSLPEHGPTRKALRVLSTLLRG